MGWDKVDEGIVCPRCGNRFYKEGYVKYLPNWDGQHCYNCSSYIEFKRELDSLVGCKVIAIEERGDLYFLVFDNGKKLTGEDGEYGNNALRFFEQIEEEEVNNE